MRRKQAKIITHAQHNWFRKSHYMRQQNMHKQIKDDIGTAHKHKYTGTYHIMQVNAHEDITAGM